LVEVRARIATIPRGEMHDVLSGWLIAVRASIAMQARPVEGHRGGAKAETWGGGRRHETVECWNPGVLEGLQGSTEGVIMELLGGNAGRNASAGGLILAKPGDQGECLIDNPQAIEPHGCDGFASREVPSCWVLLGGLGEEVANAEVVEHPSDKTAVVQDLATVWGWVRHNHLL
jgi:hypothetical protein